MEFPRFVYRAPGRGDGQNGTLYDYEQVCSQSEFDSKISAGWKATRDEALGKVSTPEPDQTADDSAPTRTEMEQKARELGLKFDGRTTDRKLAAMIAEKLGG